MNDRVRPHPGRATQRNPLTSLPLALAAALMVSGAAGCSLAEEVSAESSPTQSSEPTEATSPAAPAAPAASSSSAATEAPAVVESPSPSASPSSTASPATTPTPESTSPTDAVSPADPTDPAVTPSPTPAADGGATTPPAESLLPGDFFVDQTRLEVRGICRTGSSSFELFLQDGSRFYFDLLRDGSGITDGLIFDPTSFEDIRQVAPLAENEGEAPRVRVSGVEMRSDAGYTFAVAFLVSTEGRPYCGE